MLTVVSDMPAVLPAEGPLPVIDQIVREGARAMLAAALQAEVAAYIDQFADLRAENGRRRPAGRRCASAQPLGSPPGPADASPSCRAPARVAYLSSTTSARRRTLAYQRLS